MRPKSCAIALFSFLASGFCSGQSIKLTAEEDSALQRNWQIAYDLADYDRYSWVATDSLLRYFPRPDPAKVQGWVVTGSGENRKVVFGRLVGMFMQPAFEVSFEGRKIISHPRPVAQYSTRDQAYVWFSAMNKARALNQATLDSTQFPYNTYVLGGKKNLVVYLMPAATNEYYGFCGGIRSVISAENLSVLDNRKLHRSPLITKPPPDAAALARTSSLGVIPNEVDLAQTLLFRHLSCDHIIATSKYVFVFSWDKERKNVSMKVQRKEPESAE